jgi:hypothetical protein
MRRGGAKDDGGCLVKQRGVGVRSESLDLVCKRTAYEVYNRPDLEVDL